jgi:hypothetical protein
VALDCTKRVDGLARKSKMWSDMIVVHGTGVYKLIGLSPKATQYSLYNIVHVNSDTSVTTPCSVLSIVFPMAVVGPNTDSMACALLWPLEVGCSHC